MNATTIDLDTIDEAASATKKVGVAFNDEGEPTAGFIIVSKDSQQYRDATERLRVAGVKRGANKKERIDVKTEEGALEFDRTVQRNDMEIAVAVTVGWFGFTSGGQPAAFSAAAVRKVFEARPTYRERVSAALEADTGFLPSSSTNSTSSPASTSA